MRGVILEIWDEDPFEVEFLQEGGYNLEYNGVAIFTVDRSFIGEIVWRIHSNRLIES